MKRYSGMCIGGPMDGKCAVSESPILLVNVFPPLPKVTYKDEITAADVAVPTFNTVRYSFHPSGEWRLQ